MSNLKSAAVSDQLALLWATVALVLILLAPLAPLAASLLWSCPFKEIVGIPCPTCGVSRSAILLATWNWGSALTTYPLMTLAWLALIAGGLWCGFTVLSGRSRVRLPVTIPIWSRVGIVVIVLANWVYSIATGV